MMNKSFDNASTLSVKVASCLLLMLAFGARGTSGFQSHATISTKSPSFSKHGSAFVSPQQQYVNPSSTSALGVSLSPVTLEEIDMFYKSYPLEAAILTCGVKASIADFIAQARAITSTRVKDIVHDIELRRNIAYVIYGGIFVGAMTHFEYNYFFPMIFGANNELSTVVMKILFDNFITGPFLWLPPAYLLKAMIFDYPLMEGFEKYKQDVKDGLFVKYWCVWLPAQTMTFSVIPDHLRVPFVAFVSFFWFILFSAVSAGKTEEELKEAISIYDDNYMLIEGTEEQIEPSSSFNIPFLTTSASDDDHHQPEAAFSIPFVTSNGRKD